MPCDPLRWDGWTDFVPLLRSTATHRLTVVSEAKEDEMQRS